MAGRKKPLVRSERYKWPMCLRNIRRVIQRQLMGKCGSGQTCYFLLAKEGRNGCESGDLKKRWVAVEVITGGLESPANPGAPVEMGGAPVETGGSNAARSLSLRHWVSTLSRSSQECPDFRHSGGSEGTPTALGGLGTLGPECGSGSHCCHL